MTAAYFAVHEPCKRCKHWQKCKHNAVIFAALFKHKVESVDLRPRSPMEYSEEVALFYPSEVVPRITRQGGLFSIHKNPRVPLDATSSCLDGLQKIVIHGSYRQKLLADLSSYGVNRATLFPDLDGCSAFFNWTVESGEYWGEQGQPENGGGS